MNHIVKMDNKHTKQFLIEAFMAWVANRNWSGACKKSPKWCVINCWILLPKRLVFAWLTKGEFDITSKVTKGLVPCTPSICSCANNKSVGIEKTIFQHVRNEETETERGHLVDWLGFTSTLIMSWECCMVHQV